MRAARSAPGATTTATASIASWSSAAFLDDTGLPSFIMARGYYTRTTLTAWNWRGGQLTQLWQFDSNVTPKDAAGHAYTRTGRRTA